MKISELKKDIESRISFLKAKKENAIELADKFEQEFNLSEEDWYRTRALQLSARIDELQMILRIIKNK